MRIEGIKSQVIQELGRDPFADPTSWELIEKRIPENLWSLLIDRSGGAKFVDELPNIFNAEEFTTDEQAHLCWERIGNYYKNRRRYFEAISIYNLLYDQFLAAQEISGQWIQKATPLVWMGHCFTELGFLVHAKRYLMLAHCDDSIAIKGTVSPGGTGVYFRMVWELGFPDIELRRYAEQIYKLYQENPEESMFPEWVLQQIDKYWMTELPSPMEAGFYLANRRYVKKLISKLGDEEGHVLETLSEYLLSCMPGCKTARRQNTPSTDYDIVCSMEGFEVDFRSEFGRYFVCECKDWDKPADFTAIAKFCRVLDSVKSRFGILFSKKGISGEGQAKYAEREQLKVFQDRGMVIIVVDQKDLEYVAVGGNLIDVLRTKYERVRLDLTKSQENNYNS